MLKITQERHRRGLSQAALARLTGIHPSTISQLEAGKVYPYSRWRHRLSEALGVPGDELFQEADREPAA